MSASTVIRAAAPGRAQVPPTRQLRGTIASEWIKLWSVSATWYSLLAAAALMLLDAGLVCAGINAHWASTSPVGRAGFDPAYRSLQGILLTQVFIGITGVLVIGGEYASGLIRTTLAAVPQRGLLLAAKAVPVAGAAWAAGTAMSFASFLLGQAMLSGPAPHASLADPAVLRAVLGGGIYLMLAALLGVALAVITRSTAAGVGALFGLLLVLPILVGGLPHSLADDIGKFLPGTAGEAMWHVVPMPGLLSPTAGGVVMAAYVAAALTTAAVLLHRRDA